ncbi:MAG: universal stress protein [Panacagrimonas sp.]
MSLPKSILCVFDSPMQHTPAMRRAVELCRRSGAQLHLLMVAFDPRIDATAELVDPEVSRLARERYTELRLRWLAEWCVGLVAQNLSVSCEVVWARKTHEAVLEKVAERAPDLVVKDFHRENVLHRWSILSSADSRLSRLCPVPIMFVQPHSPLLYGRVAAAVDPVHPEARDSELDDAVVGIAMPLAMVAGAELELVHVVAHRAGSEGLSIEIDQMLEHLRREDERAFVQFADRYGVAPEQRRLLEGGVMAELLRHIAEAQVDLVVIGSQYRRGLDRFLLGSHSEAIVSQATCDVLLVRPKGFAEAVKGEAR